MYVHTKIGKNKYKCSVCRTLQGWQTDTQYIRIPNLCPWVLNVT